MNVKHNDNLAQARRIAVQQLKSLRLAGLGTMPKPSGRISFDFSDEDTNAVDVEATQPDESKSKVSTAKANAVEEIPAVGNRPSISEARSSYRISVANDSDTFESEALGIEQRIERLALLEKRVAECTSCQELASCRKNTVFGVGSPSPELCFLGEGPGADEDNQGEPFVGQAGQLLNKIIGACKMSREEVYILNTVKCRPPGNRNPNESELENCWPYAIEQLEILQPKFICCLGSVAARALLETKQSIGRMRGQFYRFRGSQVIVTYHPAYLLRNPSAKRQVWDDMKLLLAKMGREI